MCTDTICCFHIFNPGAFFFFSFKVKMGFISVWYFQNKTIDWSYIEWIHVMSPEGKVVVVVVFCGGRRDSGTTIDTKKPKGDPAESWRFPLRERSYVCSRPEWGPWRLWWHRDCRHKWSGRFAELFDRTYYVIGHVPPLRARLALNGSESIKRFERDQPT